MTISWGSMASSCMPRLPWHRCRAPVCLLENSNRQTGARQRCHGRRGIHDDAIDPHDMVMMYQFLEMEPEKVRAYLERCEEMAAAGVCKGLEERVKSWRESVG